MGFSSILLALSGFLLREWKSLYEIFAKLFLFATRDQHHGTYEGIEFEVKVEILDATGQFANYHKRHRVKFIQDNVRLYQDIMWARGIWEIGYSCSPGEQVNVSHEGDRWNIDILLKDPKNKGDEEEFNIQAVPRGAFTEAEERLQVEIRNPTKLLILQVVFPADRHSKQVVIQQRGYNDTIVLGAEHIRILPDGRQVVTWQAEDIQPLQVFTYRFTW